MSLKGPCIELLWVPGREIGYLRVPLKDPSSKIL